MISAELAFLSLKDAANELMSMSYWDLEALAKRLPFLPNDEWRELKCVRIGETGLHIYVLIGIFGILRKRISVEMIVISEDGSIHPGVIPCVYFERFRSGRLCVAKEIGRMRRAVVFGLLYTFIVAAPLSSVGLIWYFFFRTK